MKSDVTPDGPDSQVAFLVFSVSIILYLVSYVAFKSFSQKYIKSYKGLTNDEKIEWGARSPSTVHAVVLSYACIYLFLFTDLFSETKNTLTPFLYRSSPFSAATLVFSSGYFFTDILMFLFHYPHGSLAMNFHHVCAMISVTISGFTGMGHVYVLMVMATEITTPLVNARWLLDKAGLKQSKAYIYNGISMMVAWFLVRIVFLGFWYFPLIYRHGDELVLLNDLYRVLLVSIPPLLTVLNVFWFGKMVKGAIKVLQKKKS